MNPPWHYPEREHKEIQVQGKRASIWNGDIKISSVFLLKHNNDGTMVFKEGPSVNVNNLKGIVWELTPEL